MTPFGLLRTACARALCAVAGLAALGCTGAMACSYPILRELAPGSDWSDETTYLGLATSNVFGTARVVRWESADFPLGIRFEHVPGWSHERRAAAEASVMEAFGWWTGSIAPGLPSFRVDEDSRRPDVIVKWSPVAIEEDQNLAGNSRAGLVSLHVVRTEIWLREAYVEDGDTQLLQQVAAHEMGHVLGIWGHSPRESDLMYPSVEGAARLSARDRATLEGLYVCRSKTLWEDER